MYKTTDIILGAYLLSKGYVLQGITVDRGGMGTFIFTDSEDVLDEVDQYDLGNALCEPVSLNRNIQRLVTTVRRIGRDQRDI